ncbi:GspE/PulE family protein [Hydrogenothermus marinus]|uniref:General secretion pathway protein E n=1 Tax=Hydrogenothermus marinus TaxID=133270 RepID=A0A3M0BSD4_9AQUI|nr:GspE/PulE family protein [Hydrogenothermus marinus]RMA97748.1 general secretion pathway protein E [Hydrogenothermus marinus]
MEKLNFSIDFYKNNYILPAGENKFYITDKTPFFAVEDVKFYLNTIPELIKISEKEFQEKLEEYISNISHKLEEETEENIESVEDILQGSDTPVIQLLNSTFIKAIRTNASDIHFEPFKEEVLIRFRMDGVLHQIDKIPTSMYSSVVSRIKVISKLNIAEKRLPQDGRVRIKIGNKEVDMRVSTLPTVFGERVVIRLLDKANKILTLKELGLYEDDYKLFESIITKPYGLILVTGPTGSGKSTTLYASLLKLKTPRKNILTVEDPVEYQIDGISQIQVNPKIGLTFASGLRSILRQDPDIIMVGEIRDLETAEMAIHASMTGHLVLSTLHTNDAPSSITRLADIGIEPFLIASSLEGVIAQRLVRRICENCKTEVKPSEEEKEFIKKHLNIDKDFNLYKGKGCEKCLNTGYKGRIAIYEILKIDEDLRSLISKNTDSKIIRDYALKNEMRTLLQDGLRKAINGITTVEEVLQVAKS